MRPRKTADGTHGAVFDYYRFSRRRASRRPRTGRRAIKKVQKLESALNLQLYTLVVLAATGGFTAQRLH
jgi:hypothetical protein